MMSSGPGGSRPSPGAIDPRVEPVLTAIGAETELPYMARSANYVHAETTGEQRAIEIAALQAADADADRRNVAFAERVIAAADAADRAADPPWIRIRCDEATVEWLARWWFINESADTAKEWDSGRYSGKPMWRRRARVMLAALQEAGGSSDQTVNPGDDPLPIGEFAPDRAALRGEQ